MTFEMTKTGPKLSEDDLIKLEKQLGFVFPSPYRKFLLAYNGGQPNPEFFEVPGWRYKQSLVNELKGIIPGGEYVDLEEDIELMEGRLPRGFIPIGDDPGGNMIVISLNGPTRGKIYFFDHENEPDVSTDNLEDYTNLYLLADDFDTFLNNLKHENEL